jgi:hypothetical protein
MHTKLFAMLSLDSYERHGHGFRMGIFMKKPRAFGATTVNFFP